MSLCKGAIAGRGIARRLLLPTERALEGVSGQGWQIDTVVGKSQVPGAGNGRFALHDVAAKTHLVVKPLVPMAKVDSLSSLPTDRTVTFEAVGDLEKYIQLSAAEGNYSRKEILTIFEHFIYGFDGQRACLNASTWSINHADTASQGLNVNFFEKKLDDGSTALVGEAINDIQVNDELHNNYREFKLPDFYTDYCQAHDFKDVRTCVLEAVDGKA